MLILVLLSFLYSGIAVGEPLTLTATATAVSTAPDPDEALFPDCQDVTVKEGMAPEEIAVLWASVMVGLRALAGVLGKAAAAGSGSANVAVRAITYLLAILSWLSGKLGWSPGAQSHAVKLLPKWKAKPAS